MSDNQPLTPEQTQALFDVLSHYETYKEIEQFKSPDAIHKYGPPFQDDKKSSSPILQTLLSKFVLRLPGLRDVSPDFWKVRVEDIVGELSAAELSESYDKGVLGIRKTLATAIAALIEYPARGCLGGFIEDPAAFEKKDYDKSKADDVLLGWSDFLQQLVYGDLFDRLFAKAAETNDLSKHEPLVQAAHEFVVVNLASFLHYTLILSPEGPSLLRMVENVHKLVPYVIIRQTLRVGNVATMINGMMKLMLAKISIGSVTNWIGMSSGADEGMNLLQQIMSQVLGWDKRELKKRAEKLEKDKDGPSKEQREALNTWIAASREEHLETRNRSREQSMSIVAVILSLSSASPDLDETAHAKALEYLSLRLSIRDRNEITRVLCHHNPDHLTQAIRDGVSAYEPMIRQVHQAVDLSATVGDFEAFMNDLIKLSKPRKAADSSSDSSSSAGKPPSVEEYVKLLHTHQGASHRFLHQVASNSPEITGWFNAYVHEAATHFAQPADASTSMPAKLGHAFTDLGSADQATVRDEVIAHARYLEQLHASSAARIREVLGEGAHSTAYGPGAYLARWQQLLDATAITPATAKGAVRWGASKAVKEEARRDVDGKIFAGQAVSADKAQRTVEEKTPECPSTQETVRLLGPGFRELLGAEIKR